MGAIKRLFGSSDDESSEVAAESTSKNEDPTQGWGPYFTHEDGSALDEEAR